MSEESQKTWHMRIVKCLWLSGCHSSVVRALVTDVSGPGFDSQWLQAFFTYLFQPYLISAVLRLMKPVIDALDDSKIKPRSNKL